MLTNDALHQKISGAISGSVLSRSETGGILDLEIEPAKLPAVVRHLRDDGDLRFEMLVDLVSVDYSEYPVEKSGRFGLVYNLKSLSRGHRILLHVHLPAGHPTIGSIHDLYKNANWLEREAWDQMGIVFDGHPNLRRLLNHIQFVGHPLRKDYPITRGQWLSESDSLMEEMDQRLTEKGYSK